MLFFSHFSISKLSLLHKPLLVGIPLEEYERKKTGEEEKVRGRGRGGREKGEELPAKSELV